MPGLVKTLDELLDPCDVLVTLASTNYGGVVPDERRRGIMTHYDASISDASGVGWFRSKEFKLSYNRAYEDDGRRVRLTPTIRHRAYHAGVCRTTTTVPAANTAFYGLALTANAGDEATDAQFRSLAYDCAVIARYHRWPTDYVDFWLTGHEEWAVFNQKDNPSTPALWGKLGRKHDPTGPDSTRPVLSLNSLRAAVATLLDTPTHDLWRRFAAA